jgi:hypothetical protein
MYGKGRVIQARKDEAEQVRQCIASLKQNLFSPSTKTKNRRGEAAFELRRNEARLRILEEWLAGMAL